MIDLAGIWTPEHIEHRFRLPDGRTLAVAEWGDPAGLPCFMIHGTPGGRISWWKDPEIYARHGLRRLTLDRPGYGASTRRPARIVADIVGDIVAVADALGIGRFAVTGGSGGGPHALALAALVPERVIRCQANVSVAPFEAEGLDWFAGQTEGNVKEFQAALDGEAAVRRLLTRLREETVAALVAGRDDWMGEGYDLCDADVEQMRRHGDRIRAQQLHALAPGPDGWIDDDIAFTRPWGFDVAAIRVPVVVAYGRTDVLVPPAHGDWLVAHIPGAEAWVDGQAGHLGDDSMVDRDLAWLAQPDPRAA